MDYRMGDAVEVVDGESSWSAKILEIKDGSALVHFLKFNARHDEWIPLDRMKRKGELPPSSCDQKEFKVGERVMAPWKYGRKYPGVVMERESRAYKVKFYDGVTVSVKPSTMRYLRKDEIPSAKDEEEDEDNEEDEDDNDEGTQDEGEECEEEECVTPSSGRRERKSKFNIKDLLSVRTRRPQKSSSGPTDESGEDECLDTEETPEQLSDGKNKSVAKKGTKDAEDLKTSNKNHHHSRLSKGSDSPAEEPKVKKPQKKASSSSGETLSDTNSVVNANSSKNSVEAKRVNNKLSKKSFRLSSSSSSSNKSSSKSDKKQSESSSKKHTSKKDSSSTSSRKSSSSKGGKEETATSSNSKDSRKPSRKSETSLKSSKSLDNQPKEEPVSSSNKVKKLSHRKNEDKTLKSSSKSSSSTSSSKRLSDPEKENSKRTQLKRSESKGALMSSKDPLHKSSPQGTKNEIRSLKEETETKKSVKRDEMPASECLSHEESEEVSSVSDSKKLCNSECDRNGKSEEESNEMSLEKKENPVGDDAVKESDKSSDPKKKKETNSSSVSEPNTSSKKEESSSSKSAKVNGGSLKPRITEPLLKEGPPIALVTGKRERKRKKFWDEEEDTPILAPPPKSTKRSGDLSTRRSSSSVSSNTHVNNSHEPEPVKTVTKSVSKAVKVKFKTEADVRAGNGKKLEYLLFDMTQEPKLIAKQMVEGYNIPGPGVPIPVDSSNLPDGWEKRVIQRGLGVTRGKWDVFIQNAAGKSFRSKTELQKHFDENHLNYSIESFDFSLDDNLKRLRQIWKQYVIKPNLKPGEKFSSPVPAKYNRKVSSAKHSKDSSVLSSLNTNLPSYLPRVQTSSSLSASKIKDNGSDTPTLKNPIPSPLGLETLQHSPGGDSSPGIVSETGQGLRCKINKCGKLFRNDKLLLMHVKHYHPEFRDSFPPVSCVPPGDGIEDDEGILGGKRKSESSSLTVSAPPEKKLKTLLPEVDRRKVVSSNHESTDLSTGRKRNDSSLSVGSGCTTDGERAASPTQAKFKSNQRKQFQLGSRRCTFLATDEDGKGQDDSNSEMDASTTSADHLTSEEVVNCTCRRLEEDGLMIQCDLCLCWQHGSCLGIFDEDQVPEKHVCSICKDPPGRRHAASRTQIDQDLLKEGKLICIPSSSSSSLHSAKQDAFRKLSDLMADLIGLSKILHSLRIKISVASQKSSSKVFMWSSPWISPHQPPKPEKEVEEEEETPVECGTSEALDIVDNNEVPALVGSAEGELNGFKEPELGDSIDPSMIPSVSEVQELLPSIIEAEGLLQGSQEVDEGESFTPDPPPPILPTFIPEPKRIDKDESRNNLIQHIDDVQCEVEERLNILEENLVRLEKDDKYSQLTIYDAVNADCAKTKAIIQMLLLDLSTGKTMLGTI